MTPPEIARNIAVSLTSGGWTSQSITLALVRRFPATLHRLVPGIVEDLLTALPARYAPSAKTVAQELLYIRNFERALVYCRKRQVWPAPDLHPPVMAPITAFAGLDVPQLPTLHSLAAWLSLPLERLDYLADPQGRFEEHGETAINHYHYILQAKKIKGVRVIEAPKTTLKSIQPKIARDILNKLPDHPDSFGFVKRRNCLQGAARHAGEAVVVCFDLKDFFPSIGSGRIFGLFRCLGYPDAVARRLTAFCTTATPPRILARLPSDARETYRWPHLPQGSPASPALANHVCFGLDRRLSALARRLDAQYSRYADDLSFSGDEKIIGPLVRLVPQIARDEGFVLHPTKTRIMHHTSQQRVTGVVVNRHLNIDRKAFDHLKAVIHACGKPDDLRLTDPAFRASLHGKIDWVETVNPGRGRKLRHLLARAAARF